MAKVQNERMDRAARRADKARPLISRINHAPGLRGKAGKISR